MGTSPQDVKIQEWLETFTLEEILEQNDLEVEEALVALWKLGLIQLPDFLESVYIEDEDNEL